MGSNALVGGEMLRLVTAGMYNDPLVLYREYIQNAADSIATLEDGASAVTIKIDVVGSQVTILDDGAGLSPRDAAFRLLAVGSSGKDAAVDRGIHGVGRLSALAFAERVHFTTRSSASEAVTRVSWDGRALRRSNLERYDASAAIEDCTTIRSVSDGAWPSRFFQVEVDGVVRQAASALLNPDAVRRYVGEVCPVPMAESFPFGADIGDFLSAHGGYFTVDVFLDGERGRVERPFREAIPLTDSYGARFERLEKRHIPRVDGDEPAAIVWLAHTPYIGSIPRRLGVRGLRARAGNIQIGSDDVFGHLFLESRFNGWCVGEVHILDRRIVPNARRDYFEPSVHLRNLENHVGAVTQEIGTRCRAASSHRNKLRQVGGEMDWVESARALARSGYLLEGDVRALLARSGERVRQLQRTLGELKVAPSDLGHEDFAFCDGDIQPSSLFSESSSLEGVSRSTRGILQKAFGAMASEMAPDTALEVIESIVRRLSERRTR